MIQSFLVITIQESILLLIQFLYFDYLFQKVEFIVHFHYQVPDHLMTPLTLFHLIFQLQFLQVQREFPQIIQQLDHCLPISLSLNLEHCFLEKSHQKVVLTHFHHYLLWMILVNLIIVLAPLLLLQEFLTILILVYLIHLQFLHSLMGSFLQLILLRVDFMHHSRHFILNYSTLPQWFLQH